MGQKIRDPLPLFSCLAGMFQPAFGLTAVLAALLLPSAALVLGFEVEHLGLLSGLFALGFISPVFWLRPLTAVLLAIPGINRRSRKATKKPPKTEVSGGCTLHPGSAGVAFGASLR